MNKDDNDLISWDIIYTCKLSHFTLCSLENDSAEHFEKRTNVGFSTKHYSNSGTIYLTEIIE